MVHLNQTTAKSALLYDTYVIEELKCDSNAGFKLIPAFEVVVSRNKVTVDLGTLTDEYEKEITIHTTATDKKTGEKNDCCRKGHQDRGQSHT